MARVARDTILLRKHHSDLGPLARGWTYGLSLQPSLNATDRIRGCSAGTHATQNPTWISPSVETMIRTALYVLAWSCSARILTRLFEEREKRQEKNK